MWQLGAGESDNFRPYYALRQCVVCVLYSSWSFPILGFSLEWHYLAVTKLQLSSPVLVRQNLKLPLKSRSCES
jgi:hypothetical protein